MRRRAPRAPSSRVDVPGTWATNTASASSVSITGTPGGAIRRGSHRCRTPHPLIRHGGGAMIGDRADDRREHLGITDRDPILPQLAPRSRSVEVAAVGEQDERPARGPDRSSTATAPGCGWSESRRRDGRASRRRRRRIRGRPRRRGRQRPRRQSTVSASLTCATAASLGALPAPRAARRGARAPAAQRATGRPRRATRPSRRPAPGHGQAKQHFLVRDAGPEPLAGALERDRLEVPQPLDRGVAAPLGDLRIDRAPAARHSARGNTAPSRRTLRHRSP